MGLNVIAIDSGDEKKAMSEKMGAQVSEHRESLTSWTDVTDRLSLTSPNRATSPKTSELPPRTDLAPMQSFSWL
jgi:hypothetical protein